jgi:phage I-like protein
MDKYFILTGADVDVGEAPEVISFLPLGHVRSSKGEFLVDDESLREMKQQIAKRGVDVVIDYEHQTLKGVQAPAAGWVKDIFLKDGSMQARVEWTPAAEQYLKNKEYRYLSPVITVRETDGKATGLHSLALTNTPAIQGMTPIINSQNFEGGNDNMELIKLIAKLLGLDEGATQEEVLKALEAFVEENKQLKEATKTGTAPEDEKVVANKAVCELLGLKAGSPTDSVAAKIMELKNGNIDGVNVLQELKALKHKSAEREADDAVTLALKDGKITPAQKDWAKSYALSDPQGFRGFVEKAPQVVPMGEIAGSEVKELKGKVDEATLLICKQLGIIPEDVEKYGKE